jgi:phage baseplate assembly protein W
MTDVDLAGKEFLGRGWHFPVRWDRLGAVEMIAAEEDVYEAILLVLRTGIDERVMRPGYGAGIDRHVFAPLDAGTLFRIQQDVQVALLRWEPRIIVTAVEAARNVEEAAQIDVRIDYEIDGHRRPSSLVFPFYLLDATARR